MTIELWESADLADLRQDMRLDPVPDYFQRRFFSGEFYSEDKKILFAELDTPYRRLAPYVMPTSQGKPIFEEKGENVKWLLPPYIKVKDAVRVTEARNVKPSQYWRNGRGLPSLEERFDQRVAEITAFHLRAIDMRKAWDSARAFIDAKLTISYAADQGAPYPEVTIDYGRDAGQTITLSSSYWSDPDYDIIGDLNTWSALMNNAKYGGTPNELIVGSSVAPYIQKNKGILALLSTQIRGGEATTMQRGLFNISQDQPYNPIANLSGVGLNLMIGTYKDVVEDAATGTMVDIFNPKDVLLVAPGATGTMAHGAIYDVDAFEGGNIATDVFPKMFKENDPGDMYVMHQSSPIPIPLYPNRTLKARVLA